MQVRTPEALIAAIRDCGLFTADEAAAIGADLARFGGDTRAMVRHLLTHERIPVYQLRKIVYARTHELFVGPYVILDKLGEGGMGKVYKARDGRDGRLVALKVVRPHLLANPVVRGRYEREVAAALALKHPNIAAAYEAGEAAGRNYLALEFVDGIDLARVVKKYGLLPVPEACEYLRQAAVGLQHAHDAGFVHRDIKPSNIVVSGERHHPTATEPARVRVLDMGLVRSVGLDEDVGETGLTRDGTVVGTPDYMAPEQAKNSSTVDHRADLYNLGGTFYFLLTGKPPFHTGSPIEKILRHQIDPPPPLQATRPDVPDALARIVARLMAKKPADRYATADEVARALLPLAQFADDSPAVVRRPAAAGPADAPTPGSHTALPFDPPSSLVMLPAFDTPPLAKSDPSVRTPRPRDVIGPRRPDKPTGAAPTPYRAKRKPVRRASRTRLGAIAAVSVIAVAAALVLLVKFAR